MKMRDYNYDNEIIKCIITIMMMKMHYYNYDDESVILCDHKCDDVSDDGCTIYALTPNLTHVYAPYHRVGFRVWGERWRSAHFLLRDFSVGPPGVCPTHAAPPRWWRFGFMVFVFLVSLLRVWESDFGQWPARANKVVVSKG